MVGGDVVAQDRQRPHGFEANSPGQGALPVRRAANVGALRTPIVQRRYLLATIDAGSEHRLVHAAKVLRLDAFPYQAVDLFLAGPDVLQGDGIAFRVDS